MAARRLLVNVANPQAVGGYVPTNATDLCRPVAPADLGVMRSPRIGPPDTSIASRHRRRAVRTFSAVTYWSSPRQPSSLTPGALAVWVGGSRLGQGPSSLRPRSFCHFSPGNRVTRGAGRGRSWRAWQRGTRARRRG
jgi:hypothetical protein